MDNNNQPIDDIPFLNQIKDGFNDFILSIQAKEGEGFKYDAEAIQHDLKNSSEIYSNLPIKILSILGGFIGTITFFAFLMLAGFYELEGGMAFFGLAFIGGALFLNKAVNHILSDTFCITTYIVGLCLVGGGFAFMEIDINAIIIMFACIGFLTMAITQNYIFSFLAVLLINGCIVSLIGYNEVYDLIHVYVSGLAILLTAFYMNEAKIISISPQFTRLYSPIRIGLVFSFIFAFGGLVLFGKRDFVPSEMYMANIWISSIFTIFAVLSLIYKLLKVLELRSTNTTIIVYGMSILILLLTAQSPAISGSILIILLSFFVNYRTGLVIGLLSFMYFLGQYYYDLNIDLLTKSMILMATGLLFLGFYFLMNKQQNVEASPVSS